MLEVVGVLPVEVPVRDVQERLLVRRGRVQLDADVGAAQVHVAGDAVDPQRPGDDAVARGGDVAGVADVLRVVGEAPMTEEQESGRDQRRGGAVLSRLVGDCPGARAEGRAHALRAGELDRRGHEDGIEGYQPGSPSREDPEDGAGAVGARSVDQVVVHLQHDCSAGMQEHAGAGRRVVRGMPGDPGTDPLGCAEPVARCRVGGRVCLGQARTAEASPAMAMRGGVQPASLDGVGACGFEQDHVVDDVGPSRPDGRRGYEHVLGQVRLEEEAVVVVEAALGGARQVRSRRREQEVFSRRRRAGAYRRDRAAPPDLSAAAHPAGDQVLLVGREDALGSAHVGRRVTPGRPGWHHTALGHRQDRVRISCR